MKAKVRLSSASAKEWALGPEHRRKMFQEWMEQGKPELDKFECFIRRRQLSEQEQSCEGEFMSEADMKQHALSRDRIDQIKQYCHKYHSDHNVLHNVLHKPDIYNRSIVKYYVQLKDSRKTRRHIYQQPSLFTAPILC